MVQIKLKIYAKGLANKRLVCANTSCKDESYVKTREGAFYNVSDGILFSKLIKQNGVI